MKKVARLLATVVALLGFGLLLPVVALMHAFEATVLDLDFVSAEVQQIDLEMVARESLKKELAAGEPTDRVVLEIMIHAVKTDPSAKEQLANVVAGFHGYLIGGLAELDVRLNLVDFKARLLKSAKENLSALLPPEIARQLAELPLEERQENIARWEQELVATLSEKIPLPSRLTFADLPEASRHELEVVRKTIGIVRQVKPWVYLTWFALAGGLVWLGALRWLAGVSVMGALLTMGLAWLTEAGLGNAIATDQSGNVPAPVRAWCVELLGRLVAPVFTFGVVLIAGCLVVWLGFVLSRRSSPASLRHRGP